MNKGIFAALVVSCFVTTGCVVDGTVESVDFGQMQSEIGEQIDHHNGDLPDNNDPPICGQIKLPAECNEQADCFSDLCTESECVDGICRHSRRDDGIVCIGTIPPKDVFFGTCSGGSCIAND